jgi:hypothetical protein
MPSSTLYNGLVQITLLCFNMIKNRLCTLFNKHLKIQVKTFKHLINKYVKSLHMYFDWYLYSTQVILVRYSRIDSQALTFWKWTRFPHFVLTLCTSRLISTWYSCDTVLIQIRYYCDFSIPAWYSGTLAGSNRNPTPSLGELRYPLLRLLAIAFHSVMAPLLAPPPSSPCQSGTADRYFLSRH